MRIDVARLAALAFLIDAVLISIGVWFRLTEPDSYTLWSLVELDAENSIPAWYSSAKLLLIAILLACLSTALAPSGRFNLAVALAALFFLLMSCDEAVQLHELTQNIVARFVDGGGVGPDSPNLPLVLVLVLTPALLLGVLVLRAAVLSMHACTDGKVLLCIGFAVVMAGGIGLDLLRHEVSDPFVANKVMPMSEEAAEILGGTLLLLGAARALASVNAAISFTTARRAPAVSALSAVVSQA